MAVDRCPLTLIAFNVYPAAEYYEGTEYQRVCISETCIANAVRLRSLLVFGL